ncbi:MAG: methyltransferase family protein [Candidatus Thorarchaeota archaeon]
MVGLFNLWLFYLGGYVIAYSIQTWVNRKRGEPFDDPEFLYSDKKIIAGALTWIVGGFIISLFVPINFGILFYIGLPISIVGMIIGIFALYSFAHNSGLTTARIHRYSRNPIYLGWTVFFLGLTLIGWSESIWSIMFFLYFLVTIPYLHWTVLLEENFLASKYGESYQEYVEKTPRYFGIPK